MIAVVNTEHFSKTNNNNNDKKENTNNSTNSLNNIYNNIDKKEGLCDKRLSHTHFFKNNNYNNNTEFDTLFNYLNLEDVVRYASRESTRPEFLNIRVKRSIKMLYTLLDLHEKRLLRDIIENLILQFYTNKQLVEQKNIVVNVNVNNVMQVNNNDNVNVNVVKLKKQVDKLTRELEDAVNKNLELMSEIERLKKNCTQKQSDQQQANTHRLLSNALFTVLVARQCIDVECDRDALRNLLDKTISEMQYSANVKREIVESFIKRIAKK